MSNSHSEVQVDLCSKESKFVGYTQGIILTLVLALLARTLATLPFLSIMGTMVISIMLGMFWSSVMGIPQFAERGITFSSKILLRIGIIFMGLRLNISDIIAAGVSVLFIDIVVITFTLVLVINLGKWFKVNKHLSVLTAVGTAICGAAAIVAVAPLINSKKEHTAVAVATIAIMGTVGTIIYTLVFPYLTMDSYSYGVWTGATLHELAHVIAAAQVGGEQSSQIGILVKLGRVAMLIPVSLLLAYLFTSREQKGEREWTSLPIPWFIFGFLAMSVINTLGWIPSEVVNYTVSFSVFLLSMAMAGLGLGINFRAMRELGIRSLLICFIGSLALSLLGPILLKLL